MMSSPWKKKQPEDVAEMVLRRAEISKVRQLLDSYDSLYDETHL